MVGFLMHSYRLIADVDTDRVPGLTVNWKTVRGKLF